MPNGNSASGGQRSIIDRRAIADRLQELRPGKRLNAQVREILKAALAEGRAEIARRLTDDPGQGREAARATAFLHDQIVRLAFDHVTLRLMDQAPGGIALVGLGGTGRGEMAPGSDLDLMVLTAKAPGPEAEQAGRRSCICCGT